MIEQVQIDRPVEDRAGRSSEPAARAPGESRARVLAALSFRNISAIYIFIGLFVIFSIWVPDTFLTWGVWRSMFATQSLNAIVAVALVLPLAAGLFDLAVGAEVGVAGVLVAWFLTKGGMPIVPAIVLTLIAGGVIGTVTGLLVVRAKIDSFIATLAMSSVLLALTDWISSSQQILGLGSSFQSIATVSFLGLTLPVWFMLALGVVVWYILERTPVGRRVYATGGNINAARLTGVRTTRVIIGTLAACGVMAASAGVLQSSTIATGDPTIGPGFLLPGFAAAFLGSTQFRGGRYNVWGTILAVYVLATGVTGLQLAGAPVWIPSLFNGVALLLAVALAKSERGARRAGAIRRTIWRGRSPSSEHPVPTSSAGA
ncbi:MAG TPA: ABC transporter permease [Solirubrobacteraceae bacterium]|nr:ABC transporter permease [Solirubrobacteraceae bacterium]